ncbi:uncharacterized protein LOC123262724 [Cotesia glomerata]|uniref:Secreted protein n=1 Tax=Cotesia glomerata TaxID=32391 RepID=A0AAV7IMY8_COTGL|nr:uncharacterized protein LOC123262724 [Cotesia glomerata]KAH0554487.1 hypothetical protein KQX54_010961 [Cotesia glomerata]
MIFVKALIFATFCVAASLQQAPETESAISACPGQPKPANLFIDNCGTKCMLYEDSKATARWQFQTKQYTTLLRPKVRLTVPWRGKKRVYFISEDILATSLALDRSLPMQAGAIGTVMFDMMVPKETWTFIPFECTIELVDQSNNTLSCFNAWSEIRNKL